MDAAIAAVTLLEGSLCSLYSGYLQTVPCSTLVRVLYSTLTARLALSSDLYPDKGPHAFLSGAKAEALAKSLGEELVDPSYFFTEHRWREHRRGLGLPEEPLPANKLNEDVHTVLDRYPTGTVGAVALDIRGCISVVTSTGGRTNKLVGRIGDTPISGAGFWAEDWKEADGNMQAVGITGTGGGDISRSACLQSDLDTLLSTSLDGQLH
ncbi:hypothetical protein AX15_004666 [Amanita polypyramis BW_CC]|nr:hypothetical protein AX15_004666 [Amanita polypyramis BW_CC]